ncbi:hypothetical protein WN943_015727 [Citrus x changshan-huyou]
MLPCLPARAVNGLRGRRRLGTWLVDQRRQAEVGMVFNPNPARTQTNPKNLGQEKCLFIIIGPGCCRRKLGFDTVADALRLLSDRSQFDLNTAPLFSLPRSLSFLNSIRLHLRFGRRRPNDWINL